MKKISVIAGCIFRFICVLILAAAFLAFAYFTVSFVSHKSRYDRIEKFYSSDSESFETVKSYMESVYIVGMKYAELDCETGILSVTYKNGKDRSSYDICADENAVSALKYLRDKYSDKGYPKNRPEENNNNFLTAFAKYDESGNMQLTIYAWLEPLNTKGNYENPDKIIYSLDYCGKCANEEECSSHKYCKPPFENGWRVWSKKGYAG